MKDDRCLSHKQVQWDLLYHSIHLLYAHIYTRHQLHSSGLTCFLSTTRVVHMTQWQKMTELMDDMTDVFHTSWILARHTPHLETNVLLGRNSLICMFPSLYYKQRIIHLCDRQNCCGFLVTRKPTTLEVKKYSFKYSCSITFIAVFMSFTIS